MVRNNTIPANKVVLEKEATGKESPTCRHYWVIESPEGPLSRGICKFCGQVKEFHNSWAGLGSAWTRPSSPHVRHNVPDAVSEPEPEDIEPEAEDTEPPIEELDTADEEEET